MKQPVTLRLADDLEKHVGGNIAFRSAAELRRLHKVNEELVFALKYIEAQTHLGHIHDTASSELAKARGTE